MLGAFLFVKKPPVLNQRFVIHKNIRVFMLVLYHIFALHAYRSPLWWSVIFLPKIHNLFACCSVVLSRIRDIL